MVLYKIILWDLKQNLRFFHFFMVFIEKMGPWEVEMGSLTPAEGL